MLNVGVVCDTNWDNFIIINNKFKKINTENYRLHALYGKTLELINNCCIRNTLTLIRHYSENLSKTVYNLLKVCDIWLIFTNNIEYNTQTRLVIDKCDEYNIKYIIISEYNTKNDYYSYISNNELSFKKNINNIQKADNLCVISFNDELYNYIYSNKCQVPILLPQEIKQKLKDNTSNYLAQKNEKCIKLLYDKNEFKKEKEINKNIKTLNQINFTKNRNSYYNNNK